MRKLLLFLTIVWRKWDCDNCKNVKDCRFVDEGRRMNHCNFYLPVIPPLQKTVSKDTIDFLKRELEKSEAKIKKLINS